ncbi:MAG: GDSL-type esterase/lipase family protein [Elusimicrobiota bacterium]|nr:MAG: GDSL-type esterase/lipase family protein [Elusimicrobiota bacterium]
MRLVLAALLLAACSKAPDPSAPAGGAANAALFIGDSLTAGFGVEPEEAWPALVGAEWARRGLPWRARNAGVSGATTAGALEQAKWALTPDVKLVFVCIGGNDGLRGLALGETKKNVANLLAELQKDGRTVVLAGMKIPRTTAPTTRTASPRCSRPSPNPPARATCRSCSRASPPTRATIRPTASIPTPRATR